MNCAECHALLQQRLDGEPIADAGLDRHLAGCPECRQLFAAGRRLEEGLLRLPLALPPVGLNDRLVAAILADRRRRLIRRRLAAAAGFAVAASVVVAVWLGSGGPAPQPVPGPMVQVQPPPPSPTAPSLRDSVDELGAVVAALVRRATAETLDQTLRLWPDPMPETAAEPAADLLVQSLYDAGQGVSAGLEPVTSSARRAVDLFLRELPPMTGTETMPN
jgi:hypothetical protein